MRDEQKTKEKKRREPLHPIVLIFGAMIVAMLMTCFVPLGQYEFQTVSYVANGEQQTTKVVDSNSFRYVMDENGEKVIYPASIFGEENHGQVGMMNSVFAGLSGGQRAAWTASVIAYLLVIGGSCGIVMRTGVVDQWILRVTHRVEHIVMLIPPLLFLAFSWGGAVFGLSEYCIPLAILVIPLLIGMDFDAVTGVLVTFAATQIGTAFSWMHSEVLYMAQTLAGIPTMSGMRFRIIMWAVFTLLGAAYTTYYAWKIHTGSRESISNQNDARFRGRLENLRERRENFGIGSRLVMLTMGVAILWMVWGIYIKEYNLSDIATLFFVAALICGGIATVYHLNGMKFADIPRAFQSGASNMIGPVLVIGMAQGLALLLGGINPTEASVINTLLHWAARVFSMLTGILASWMMYLFHICLNFIIPSNLGQAALSIPIMAPLADALGISRQIAITAFQMGTSFSQLLFPTSGCLIAILSVANLHWSDWVRSQWKIIAAVCTMGIVVLTVGFLTGYA